MLGLSWRVEEEEEMGFGPAKRDPEAVENMGPLTLMGLNRLGPSSWETDLSGFLMGS